MNGTERINKISCTRCMLEEREFQISYFHSNSQIHENDDYTMYLHFIENGLKKSRHLTSDLPYSRLLCLYYLEFNAEICYT